MKYELCYLVGESKEQELPKIKEEISKIVFGEGGKWLELQIEEKRKMAYKVEKEVRGIYIAQQFEISKDSDEEEESGKNIVESISKKLNLNQNILRFIIIKAEDLPELKVREARPAFAKTSGTNRYSQERPGNGGRKPTYIKREFSVKKEDKKAEEPTSGETPEAEKKEEKTKEPVEHKTKEGEKTIDEKIDEILNI
jgi:ribosomal protein S6